VNPTLFALIAELVKITSVGAFCKNSTEYLVTVKVLVVAAPIDVEMLTVISPPVSLHKRTHVAEFKLVAVPAVVGVEICVSMTLVICIITITFQLFMLPTNFFPVN
jgi:hypothetical protein